MLRTTLTKGKGHIMKMNTVDYIAWVLIVVGGLNWGLVGAFDYNLVDSLFGVDSTLSNVVYILVGLAAVYSLISVLMKLSSDKS
jgi:hypothetical protein